VKQNLEIMIDALAQGQRIEIRGFAASVCISAAAQGRNPKTGETVALAGKYVAHFNEPGKDLRERVNESSTSPAPASPRSRLSDRAPPGAAANCLHHRPAAAARGGGCCSRPSTSSIFGDRFRPGPLHGVVGRRAC